MWKTTHTIPLYKGKGSKFDVSHYRPVSLRPVFCKIMETIIRTNVLIIESLYKY